MPVCSCFRDSKKSSRNQKKRLKVYIISLRIFKKIISKLFINHPQQRGMVREHFGIPVFEIRAWDKPTLRQF